MAPPLNPGQARTIDPILTQVARGYRNAAHAWMYLFPVVTVMQRGGKIIKFGAEQFASINSERAPGATRQQVHFGHSDENYALVQRALDGKVPKEILEEAMAVPGIDYSRTAVVKTMDVVSLQIEITAAGLATRAGTYKVANKSTLAAAAQWSHDDSEPAKAGRDGQGGHRHRHRHGAQRHGGGSSGAPRPGQQPGRGGPHQAHRGPDGQRRAGHQRGQAGAVLRRAPYVVARARTGKPGNFQPVWGKVAVLAFADVSSMASMGSPSYGYTYRLQGYPLTEPGWYDKSCDSWLYPVTTEDTPVVAGAEAGYLFSEAVA